MKRQLDLRVTVLVAFTIAVGLLVLLGYFVPLFAELRQLFLQWAVILAAIALIVGVVNLISVHGRKITTSQPGSVYSIVMIVSLVLTLVVAGYFGPTSTWGNWIFNYIQVPIESSLMAVLVVVLAYASARLLNRRLNVLSLIFLGTVLLVLLGSITFPGLEIPGLRGLRDWIVQVWATAGARGILLGVALGTVATALRILTGSDRPYGG